MTGIQICMKGSLALSNLDITLTRLQSRAEQELARCLPQPEPPLARLHEAMRYATLNGGKRIRACLVYASGETLGAAPAELDAPACAVELVHTYSLIHDDLPCMDDDDLRRGKPTCHKAFDEATAVLAGDALQALAFEILTDRTEIPGADRCSAHVQAQAEEDENVRRTGSGGPDESRLVPAGCGAPDGDRDGTRHGRHHRD